MPEEVDVKTLSVKERITRISNEMKVEKTGWNDYSKYAYVTPSDIDNPLKPFLVKYRLFNHFALRKKEDGKNEAVLRVEDWDTEVGRQIYTMTTEDISLKAANTAQSAAGLRTFCRRYLLMTAFNVSDDDSDYDAQDNGSEGKQKKQKAVGEKEEAPKNPDEKIKDELISVCKEKISEAVGANKESEMRSAINVIMKKYEPEAGNIKKMLTQNVKQAIVDVKKLTV
jgi:hypothetical protein